MKPWKLVCAAEAAALLLIFYGFGIKRLSTQVESPAELRHPDPSATRPFVQPSTDTTPHHVERQAEQEHPTLHAQPQPPPPDTDGRVSLVGEIVDANGTPLTDPTVYLMHGNGGKEALDVGRGQSFFMLQDRLPGHYEVEIRVSGFNVLQGPIRLRPEPNFQRQTFRLQRAWRVLVRIELSTGERLIDWMVRNSQGNAREYRPWILPSEVQVTSNESALVVRTTFHELGSFVSASLRDAGIPPSWDGALDLAADPPLFAVAWLGTLLLGTAEIREGESRVVIRLEEAQLMSGLSSLTLRVLDFETGVALPRARVGLTPHWSGGGERPVDPDGRVRFALQVPDELDLQVHCEGYASFHRGVILRPGELFDFGDVTLSRERRLHAQVVDSTGRPLAQHRIHFFQTDGWSRPENPARTYSSTDAEGLASLLTGAQRQQWIVGGGNFGLQAVVWERGDQGNDDREIRLLAGSAVRILAAAPDGQARILWLLDSEGLLLAPRHHTQFGEWSVTLTPGSYLLRVEDLDRNFLATLDLRVPDGGGDILVTLP